MNKDVKIVIDCRMYHFSGIGRYIKDLVPGICAAFEKVVLLGNLNDLSIYLSDYPNVQLLSLKAPIYSIKEQWTLFFNVPECDIFWSPHFNVPLLPIKAKYKIVTIHDVSHLAFYNQLSILQKIYAKLFYRCALKKSDIVITISQFSKKELIKYSSLKYEKKIVVIYRFVGDIISHKNDDKENYVIEETNLEPYYLFVGNIKPTKNLKRALLAFKKLINDKQFNIDKNVVFKIVGKRDGFIIGEEGIQDIVDSEQGLAERIQFTGYVSDEKLEYLYRNAVCMIFPSIYEGFGLPPLEAMVFGCPTITSNAASLPEVCGNATIYFDPYNVDDISQKMAEIITSPNLRKSLIERGLKQVKKFNKEIAIKEHVDLFQSIMFNCK